METLLRLVPRLMTTGANRMLGMFAHSNMTLQVQAIANMAAIMKSKAGISATLLASQFHYQLTERS